MFKAGQPNPYDDIVVKTTDENLTAENWELIITLCDKVVDEGESGARSVIASLLKRLAHRNPNVQLYALSLAESLSKNCGIELHREIASRAFTQALEKIVTDRTTHDKVKRRALGLVAMWTADFRDNSSLGIMEECYESLKAKNFRFEQPEEAPPPQASDELRRKEEEELQRVLEMSMHDKGGRNQWIDPRSTSLSNGEGGSSSIAGSISNVVADSNSAMPHELSEHTSTNAPSQTQGTTTLSSSVPVTAAATSVTPVSTTVTRVRALHSFQPTEPGELGFDKGDIIKVVDRNYKDWWRGQLRGRTGIFPVNYVESLPDLTPEEVAREAEAEAKIFQQAANIDKLLDMLRNLDPSKDSLADNEEIQELYRTSMTLRPKIVKLIDKYNQKKAELVSMNEAFVKAKTIFERMMEESLARHTSDYGSLSNLPQPQPRHEARIPQNVYAPNRASAYGWNVNPTPYEQPPATAFNPAYPTLAYTSGPGNGAEYPQQTQPFSHANPEPATYPSTTQPHNVYNASAVQQQPTSNHLHGPPPHPSGAPMVQQDQQGFNPHPHPSLFQPTSQPQPHLVAKQEPQQSTQYTGQPQAVGQARPQLQPQPDAQSAGAADPTMTGPPYRYNVQGQYPDSGAQAWAQYYSKGGTDPAGLVYFDFVPGVSDGEPPQSPSNVAPASGDTLANQQVKSPQMTSHPGAAPDALESSNSYGQSPYNGLSQSGNPDPHVVNAQTALHNSQRIASPISPVHGLPQQFSTMSM